MCVRLEESLCSRNELYELMMVVQHCAADFYFVLYFIGLTHKEADVVSDGGGGGQWPPP